MAKSAALERRDVQAQKAAALVRIRTCTIRRPPGPGENADGEAPATWERPPDSSRAGPFEKRALRGTDAAPPLCKQVYLFITRARRKAHGGYSQIPLQ
mmetsp:Transcript_34306/g.119862  ORF Transcript_34306/g.119862 Transcript_34306/m.119862 type:complete len:98 (+) Transcript_34306:210-503(+)